MPARGPPRVPYAGSSDPSSGALSHSREHEHPDAALQGSDPIALVEGQVSPSAEEAASRLAGYLAGGSLPMYEYTVRQNVDEGIAEEGNNCHNNILALAGAFGRSTTIASGSSA